MQFRKPWYGSLILMMAVLFVSCDKQPIGPDGPDPVGPSNPNDFMTMTDFRLLFPPGSTGTFIIPAGTKKIRGKVISNSINEAVGNFRVQDESGSGIYLYTLQGSPTYEMGKVLEIDPTGGGQLIYYNGDLELKSVPQANVVQISGTINVTPRTTTIADIITNKDTWSSSLVKINSITSIVQGSTNSTGTNYTATDATGSITFFIRTVSGITVNTSGTSITAYVSIYNGTAQLGIRTAADIQ